MLVVLALFVSVNAYSSGIANSYYVTAVRADQSGKGWIQFSSTLNASSTGLPSCGSTQRNKLAFDANTDGGKAILSIALAALSTKKRIWASGTNTCSVYGTIESYSWGSIKD